MEELEIDIATLKVAVFPKIDKYGDILEITIYGGEVDLTEMLSPDQALKLANFILENVK